jgi:ribosome-binding factor A
VGGGEGQHRYPRVFRLNQVLKEVLAEEIERLSDATGDLLTVTGVTVEPDLRHATVWLSSLTEGSRTLLEEHRVELQAAVARQTTMKRTPRLSFEVDPAVVQGAAIEDALRRISGAGEEEDR